MSSLPPLPPSSLSLSSMLLFPKPGLRSAPTRRGSCASLSSSLRSIRPGQSDIPRYQSDIPNQISLDINQILRIRLNQIQYPSISIKQISLDITRYQSDRSRYQPDRIRLMEWNGVWRSGGKESNEANFFNVQRGLRRFALSRHLPTVGRQTHQHQRSLSVAWCPSILDTRSAPLPTGIDIATGIAGCLWNVDPVINTVILWSGVELPASQAPQGRHEIQRHHNNIDNNNS